VFSFATARGPKWETAEVKAARRAAASLNAVINDRRRHGRAVPVHLLQLRSQLFDRRDAITQQQQQRVMSSLLDRMASGLCRSALRNTFAPNRDSKVCSTTVCAYYPVLSTAAAAPAAACRWLT